MRVHELAKQLSSELGKSIASSELLVYLNKKKEGMKPQSSISDELISYINSPPVDLTISVGISPILKRYGVITVPPCLMSLKL